MSEAKFTKICVCYGDNWKANAQLIAAAPEMHDSLEELGYVITRLIRGEPVRNLDEILLRRDLILKKAQGHGHE